jgi:hypothetical protein
VTKLVIFVVTYWTHAHVVMGNLFIISWSHYVILHCTKNYCTKVVYFSKIYYHTSLYDPIISGSSVTPTSQFRVSTMLVLLIIGNKKYNFRVASNGLTSTPNFIKIHPTVLELIHSGREMYRQTDREAGMVNFVCTHFVHIMHKMHNNWKGLGFSKHVRLILYNGYF